MPCSDCKSITLFKGEDGRTILSGSGSPSAGLGANGDFYIDIDAWEIYGPKTSGSWGTGTSLVGPQGFQGNYGGWSSFWRYDGTSITSGTASGDFRFNNGTLSSVDHLYINDVNADSANMQAFLDAWNNSGDFGLVRISKMTDANEFWMGIVTAETDTGSEHDISVTHVVSNGTFTDDAAYVISFVESGANGTNGTNGADGIDLYDSGWVTIGAHNGTFGLPAISNWTNPKLRVIGRHVYVSGRILVPMANKGTPTVLLNDADTYPSTYKSIVDIYTGSAGGYTINPAGAITMTDACIPSDLFPQEDILIDSLGIILRTLRSSTGANNLTISTISPSITFNSAGKLDLTSWKDVLDSAGALSNINNNPLNEIIMNVSVGEKAINYSNYKQEINDSVIDCHLVDVGQSYTPGTHTGVTTTSASGSGTGLILTVVVDAGGRIVKVTPTSEGSGYVNDETIDIDSSTGTPGIGAGSRALVRAVTDGRQVLASGDTYPVNFDGKEASQLGGFIVPFTFNYPLDPTVTEAQIIAAIASM